MTTMTPQQAANAVVASARNFAARTILGNDTSATAVSLDPAGRIWVTHRVTGERVYVRRDVAAMITDPRLGQRGKMFHCAECRKDTIFAICVLGTLAVLNMWLAWYVLASGKFSENLVQPLDFGRWLD